MIRPIDILKVYFQTGKRPTQAQFEDLIDSFVHKGDTIDGLNLDSIAGLTDALAELQAADEAQGTVNSTFNTNLSTLIAAVDSQNASNDLTFSDVYSMIATLQSSKADAAPAGMGWSSNDYSNSEKARISALESGLTTLTARVTPAQIEISTSTATADETWNGNEIIFTVNCTVTFPNSLSNAWNMNGVTLTGVTVTPALGSGLAWSFGTAPAIGEKTFFHVKKRGATSEMILGL